MAIHLTLISNSLVTSTRDGQWLTSQLCGDAMKFAAALSTLVEQSLSNALQKSLVLCTPMMFKLVLCALPVFRTVCSGRS